MPTDGLSQRASTIALSRMEFDSAALAVKPDAERAPATRQHSVLVARLKALLAPSTGKELTKSTSLPAFAILARASVGWGEACSTRPPTQSSTPMPAPL